MARTTKLLVPFSRSFSSYAGSMEFEWDPTKADSNLEKHGVPFDEATTAFGILSHSPFPTPIILTTRNDSSCLASRSKVASSSLSTPTEARDSESSALESRLEMKDDPMKKDNSQDSDMREESDFGGGIRGKYADRFAEGSNVVVLDPDVAAEFKTRKAVNDALRAQLENGRRTSGDEG